METTIYITLLEINKYDLGNKYHNEQIEKAKELNNNVSKFWPCETFIELNEYEGKYYLNHIETFLINDVCKIKISWDSYRKKYNIFSNERWNNISNWDLTKIKEKHKEPNNIGVLTTKKIESWVKYIQSIHIECNKKESELSNNVQQFIDSIKDENVNWNNDKTSGEIVKGGIVFKFKIENGHISKKIEIHYKVNSDLETFKKISKNML